LNSYIYGGKNSTGINPNVYAFRFTAPGPDITSAVASDPTNSDAVLGDGDTLIITFSNNTNTPKVTYCDDVLNVLSFNPSLPTGINCTGTWTSLDTLNITFFDVPVNLVFLFFKNKTIIKE